MAHALLSASGAERWLHCPPSARLTEKIVDTTSVFAEEGTLAHSVAEDLIREELGGPEAKLPEDNELFYPGMVDDVEPYVSYCTETYRGGGEEAVIDLESRLDFSEYVPSGFGTGDCVIVSDGVLEIIDLKFGKGVPVMAVENPQLMLYGLGALLAYDFIYDIHTVKMTIVQPRIGNIDTYELSADMLIEWAEKIKPIAEIAYQGKGEVKAGSWCRWCKIRGSCKARAEAMTEVFREFGDHELSPEETSKVLEQADAITAWVKDIQDKALEDLLGGFTIPGWKAVEGRRNRRIADPEALGGDLLEAGYRPEQVYKPQEVNNLTTLEKLVGKKAFTKDYGQYITKPPGKPALAKASDKRPALNSVEDEFDFD